MTLTDYSTNEILRELARRRDEITLAIHSFNLSLDIGKLINAAAEIWSCDACRIMKKTTARKDTEPRTAAMAIMRQSGMKLQEIADVFKVDHTTVVCAVTRHKSRSEDADYMEKFNRTLEIYRTPARKEAAAA